MYKLSNGIRDTLSNTIYSERINLEPEEQNSTRKLIHTSIIVKVLK
jgi:hypothetical protein